jgi:hypothetical protein
VDCWSLVQRRRTAAEVADEEEAQQGQLAAVPRLDVAVAVEEVSQSPERFQPWSLEQRLLREAVEEAVVAEEHSCCELHWTKPKLTASSWTQRTHLADGRPWPSLASFLEETETEQCAEEPDEPLSSGLLETSR